MVMPRGLVGWGFHIGVGPAHGLPRLRLRTGHGIFPIQPRGLAPHKKDYRLLLCTARAVSVSSWCCCDGFGTGAGAGSVPLVAGAALTALAFVLVTVLPHR